MHLKFKSYCRKAVDKNKNKTESTFLDLFICLPANEPVA
jgi:hypothetical protein